MKKERMEKIDRILNRMKTELKELESFKQEFSREVKREKTPIETKKLIEEIRVPPLEAFTDVKEKKDR